eukprot:CAMPEP_0194049292 /NCGR_PEP_ID=MMETSP0009_2-20130614/30229_1 /TAXON_ID=210454 /ORGANISM="Grammatophora oceanica, Strain CCMP 410" /LENGTH=395 /DNA_ID=CAMNT_0038695405 /DNA_START=99 /DNA_END=1286 /DNA_ORIENTATION=-
MSVTAKNAEIPLFLRKTYHMIDTCDQSVAAWSEDGKTFVVKKVDVFEKIIIPQFFKHSKFSSFVRQLNFYGFRKIKYADTIKIDAKLEAETANFWRFRHEKFLKGRPELLIEIKRSNSSTNASAEASHHRALIAKKDAEETTHLKSEVNVLKKRIEAMTKNIDDLTTMVAKVTIKDEEVGNKRKKVDTILPDTAVSSSMEVEADPVALDLPSFPVPLSPRVARGNSDGDKSNVSDEDFVNHLFTTFGNEDTTMDGWLDEVPPPSTTGQSSQDSNDDGVDAKLMKRLRDALKLVPRDMQEMIVDRLVTAITSTEGLDKSGMSMMGPNKARVPIQSGKVGPTSTTPPAVAQQQPQVPVTLAAATMAALLKQYTDAVGKESEKKPALKALPPVIPIHA